jgi:hypothetical protein
MIVVGEWHGIRLAFVRRAKNGLLITGMPKQYERVGGEIECRSPFMISLDGTEERNRVGDKKENL